MKQWYLKLNVSSVILDAVEYPAEGYVEVQLPDTKLPAGINGGWYKWTGTAYQEDATLKPIDPDTELATAINNATTLDELKKALVGNLLVGQKGKVKGRV